MNAIGICLEADVREYKPNLPKVWMAAARIEPSTGVNSDVLIRGNPICERSHAFPHNMQSAFGVDHGDVSALNSQLCWKPVPLYVDLLATALETRPGELMASDSQTNNVSLVCLSCYHCS